MTIIPDGINFYPEQDMLYGDILPDVFSPAFKDTCFLRMFIFLYDGENSPNKPYPISFSAGITSPELPDGQGTLVLPYNWKFHITGAIRGYEQCVGIFLGNDLHWNWEFDSEKGHLYKCMWIRRLIALPASSQGKKKFAWCMEQEYGTVSEWNSRYGLTGNLFHGPDITSFTDENSPTSLVNPRLGKTPPWDPFPPEYHLDTIEPYYDIVDNARITNCRILNSLLEETWDESECLYLPIPDMDAYEDGEWPPQCQGWECNDGNYIYEPDGCGE
jgi:hypothetical protein